MKVHEAGRSSRSRLLVACIVLVAGAGRAQTVQDEYAVYDLGDATSAQSGIFKTIYEVSVTTPGATEFRDGIGSGLTPVDAKDDGVVDLMTGTPLKFEVESG